MSELVIGALISGVIGITVSLIITILQHFLIQKRERNQVFNELNYLIKKYEEIGPNPQDEEEKRTRRIIRHYVKRKFDVDLFD